MATNAPKPQHTPSPFDALADPARRDLLELLASRERAVNDLADHLGLPQPAVSKHLKALRDAGLVTRRSEGRRRYYRTRHESIRPVHEWTRRFERYWRANLDQVNHHAEAAAASDSRSGPLPIAIPWRTADAA